MLVSGPKIAYFMANEAAFASAGASDGRRHPRRGGGDRSPLQTRAAFIKNWDWQSVVGINRGACERGRARHGFNSETASACEAQWKEKRPTEFTLIDLIEFLKSFHRLAPFLFFNGNTFAAIGRQLAFALFNDLPTARKQSSTMAASVGSQTPAKPNYLPFPKASSANSAFFIVVCSSWPSYFCPSGATPIIHPTPKRSSNIPNRGDQNVLLSGIFTCPPCDKAANTRSASLSLGTDRDREKP